MPQRPRNRAMPNQRTDGLLYDIAGNIRPQRVEWLWQGYIARRAVVQVQGDPGLGKTTLALDIVARLTAGGKFPDGSEVGLPGFVVVLTGEDDISRTIVPRLIAAGASLNRVRIIRADEIAALPKDVDKIEQVVMDGEAAKILMIDPLDAFVGDRVDTYKNHSIRRLLRPFAEMAGRTGAAILLVGHLNKAPHSNAMYRFSGSIGAIGAPRAGFLVARDAQDEASPKRFFIPIKNNLGPLRAGLEYVIEEATIAAGHTVATIKWLGETKRTASDLLEQPERQRPLRTRDRASALLLELLKNGPQLAEDVDRAMHDNEISERTYRRARDHMAVLATKRNGRWWLSLPEEAEPEGSRMPKSLEQYNGSLGSHGSLKAGNTANPANPAMNNRQADLAGLPNDACANGSGDPFDRGDHLSAVRATGATIRQTV
jgi:hypothetical protein